MSEQEAEQKVADELIRLFEKSPDYRERVTRYQVLYLLGRKGQKKPWYKRYTCKWAKRMKICPQPTLRCRLPRLA